MAFGICLGPAYLRFPPFGRLNVRIDRFPVFLRWFCAVQIPMVDHRVVVSFVLVKGMGMGSCVVCMYVRCSG